MSENTPERFAQLTKFFRLYINDELVPGEMMRTQGNGHEDFTFRFNQHKAIAAIKTVRVEIG